jgi:hypothetical protein
MLETKQIHRVRNEHPRILFEQEELVVLRKRIADNRIEEINFPVIWSQLKQKADEFMEESSFQVHYPVISRVWTVQIPLTEPAPDPEPPGYTDFPFWTMYARAIEEKLTILSTVLLVSKEERYAERIKMHLLSLCKYSKWYEFDHRGAEGNLSNAHLTIGVSIAYDSVHAYMTENERSLVREAILQKGLEPLKIDFGSENMHNIIAAKQVAMMYGALAVVDEEPAAHNYLNQSFEYMTAYLNRRLTTSETEGLLYNNVAARHVLMAADVFQRATGDNVLTTHSYIRDYLPEQFLLFMAPGKDNSFPNLSDSFLKLDLSYVMSMLASINSHPAAMWYTQTFEKSKPTALLNVKNIPKAVEPEIYYAASKSRVFWATGWAALRSGWTEQDHLLCFTSSASDQGHNHKDQNNFVLNVGGEWLLTNPGYQDYVPGPKADYTVGTVGHNSLLINGSGQAIRGGGAIRRSFLSPAYQLVYGDASESYQGLVEQFTRMIIHVNNRYYLIIDLVQASGEKRAELLFHTTSSIIVNDCSSQAGDSIEENRFMFKGERTAVQMDVLLPKQARKDVKIYPGAEVYGAYVSVSGLLPEGSIEAFVTLLEPMSNGCENIQAANAEVLDSVVWIYVEQVDTGTDLHAVSLEEGKRSDRIKRHHSGLAFQGREAFISLNNQREEIRSAVLVQGTELWFADNCLIRSDVPVEVSLVFSGNQAELSVNAGSEATVTLFVPTFHKISEDQGMYSYHEETGLLTLNLSPGAHQVRFELKDSGR